MTEQTTSATTLPAPEYGCFRSRAELIKAARLATFGHENVRGITTALYGNRTVRGLIYKHEAEVRFDNYGRVASLTIDGKAVPA